VAVLIDSSLWIDFTRARSPRRVKEFIAPYILAPDAVIAEPIAFEVLRHATDEEIPLLNAQFQIMPMIETPDELWSEAAKLGQRCRRKGVSAGSLDLLIVAVAVYHDAELITFDGDFAAIGAACDLRVQVLRRPG
jgi:predicted nucleic acid-binding protein